MRETEEKKPEFQRGRMEDVHLLCSSLGQTSIASPRDPSLLARTTRWAHALFTVFPIYYWSFQISLHSLTQPHTPYYRLLCAIGCTDSSLLLHSLLSGHASTVPVGLHSLSRSYQVRSTSTATLGRASRTINIPDLLIYSSALDRDKPFLCAHSIPGNPVQSRFRIRDSAGLHFSSKHCYP